MLTLPDAGALGFAGFVLDTPQRGLGFCCHVGVKLCERRASTPALDHFARK